MAASAGQWRWIRVVPALDPGHVQGRPEVVVPGDAAAAGADEAGHGEVDELALAFELEQSRILAPSRSDRAFSLVGPAQVGLVIGADPALGVAEPDRGRIGRPGLGETRPQLRWQVDEPQLGVVDREGHLGLEARDDRARPGRLPVLGLHAHDLGGQLGEKQSLSPGASIEVAFGPFGLSC
jgi:hypothetical protein